MSPDRRRSEGGRPLLGDVVVACLQGWTDRDSAVRMLLRGYTPREIRDALYRDGERYRRLYRVAFRDLVEGLRGADILW